jgi:hypothetical protein
LEAQIARIIMRINLFRSPDRRLNLAVAVASASIALLFAILSVSKFSVLPLKLERRDFQAAGAVTHVLVDLDRSGITDRTAQWAYFDRITTRADLLAHLMVTDPALTYIGRRANIPPEQIAAFSPITIPIDLAMTEPGSEMRAREILLEGKHFRLETESRPGSPIVDIYTQAPSVGQAEALANAAIAGARDYFAAVASRTTVGRARAQVAGDLPVHLRQLGAPQATHLGGNTALLVAALTFVLAFAVAFAVLRTLLAARIRRRRAARIGEVAKAPGGVVAAASGATVTAAAARPGVAALPSVSVLDRGGAITLRPAWPTFARRRIAFGDGSWPRTTRVLPWMLAAFIAMVLLVPFDSIQLNVPFPIDLKLDRIILPFIFGTWALSMAVGGRGAPRLRPTWIHAAVGGFVAIAFLSVILNASALNQSLELSTAAKKLPLLLSFLSVFLMASTVVRRDEVPAFLKYTLVLAVICAIGIVWESKTTHNLFFEWSRSVLPSVFKVTMTGSGWDSAGRRLVHGPTNHPLVAAGMLSLALPIAILGIMQARRTSGRVLYLLAGCILMLGVLSTQRKTGLVAPLAGVLTIAYFRRRELLRLAPVAVLLVIALVIVSPQTLTPVVDQFKPSSLTGASTVNDRASDYEAIRPDVLSHFALGRGYGSYDPPEHRILDSQVLGMLIEVGVIGLVAFFVMGGSVVACARRAIYSRHPDWARSALAGAAAAVTFLVLAFLFDSLAYPQVPYVFFWFAALVAVIVKSPDEDGPALSP